MRAIKFRAWHIESRQMWFDVQTAYDYMSGPDEVNNGDAIPATTFGEILERPDEWIPMQFTGLRDKNGVEMYEGDIVACLLNETAIGELDIVGFENGAFWLRKRHRSIAWWLSTDGNVRGDLRVVGNTYEHPHLLEAK